MDSITNLPALVRDKFDAARKCGALTFYETQVSVLRCNDTPVTSLYSHCPVPNVNTAQFQVRYSPVLANKPKSSKPRDPNEKPFDPFADPPADLFITGLSAHFLVLNKFPVTPSHFILATKEFKEQTHILEEEDIEAAYECLKAYRDAGQELFGFYNSGEHSGASQPHRHIQFLPVESMRSGMNAEDGWNVLTDSLPENPSMFLELGHNDLFLTVTGLPFTYFWSAVPEDLTAQQRHEIYLSLHNKAVQAFGGSIPASSPENSSPISYNMGITNRVMVVCPRTSEGLVIKGSTGETIGPVALNGTLLAGTLLVKSEAEWDALQNDESKLNDILGSISISSIKKHTRI